MASNAPQIDPEWIVRIEPAHGGEIAGQRRVKGDVFTAPEAVVRYLVLDGVVGPTPAKAPAKAAKSEPAA